MTMTPVKEANKWIQIDTYFLSLENSLIFRTA